MVFGEQLLTLSPLKRSKKAVLVTTFLKSSALVELPSTGEVGALPYSNFATRKATFDRLVQALTADGPATQGSL